ncbi:MAG: two-component system response regulator [Deltaproteobacteria bacterium]|nr:MAG: two-component system response regulator [Deltaproteobacteria bacterium]
MSKRIVIVDDSSIMRKMICNLFQSTGNQVIGEARSGREAVELYKSLKPDIVIMDITMRDMDGFSAAKKILSLDPQSRIIFLSNLDKEQYSAQAADIGALGFVNKHNLEELLEFI